MAKFNVSGLYLIGVVSFFFSLGCKDKGHQDKNELMTSIVSDSSAPISGVFQAKLPCADCAGILTKIYLRKDYTFIKEDNYQGVSDTMPHIFYDLGTWSWKDSSILLAGQTADTLLYRLKTDKSLQLLAQDGNPLPDSLAAVTRFNLIGNHFQTQKAFLVSGVLDKTDNQYSFYACLLHQTFSAKFTSETQKTLLSYWKKLKNPDAQKAIVQAQVSFDSNNSHQFKVEKINNVIDGESCN